jgi:hypothetical protein
MTVVGDMAAYVASRAPGIDMPTARVVIALALEAADDPNFACAFQREVETALGFTDYFDVIKFLRKVNR